MKRLLRAFLYSCVLAILSLVVVAYFWNRPVLLTFIMISISILMLLIWRTKEDLYLYLITGVCGALAEVFAISMGAWTYASPNLKGIPYWLPFLWGVTGLFVKRMANEIHDFVKH